MGGYLVLHPHRRVTVIMLRMLTEVPGYAAVGLWFVFQPISAFGVIGRTAGQQRRCIHGPYRRLHRRHDTRQICHGWTAGQSAWLGVAEDLARLAWFTHTVRSNLPHGAGLRRGDPGTGEGSAPELCTDGSFINRFNDVRKRSALRCFSSIRSPAPE